MKAILSHPPNEKHLREWFKFLTTTRILIITAFFAALIFAFVFYLIDHPTTQFMFPITLGMTLWYLICFYANVKGKANLSRNLLAVGGLSWVITAGWIVGRGGGGILWVLAFAPAVFVAFPYNQRWIAIAWGFIALGGGIIISIFGSNDPFIGDPFTQQQEDALHTFLWAGIFLFIGSISYSFYRSSMRYERELEKERSRSDRLLLNILPFKIANRLKQKEKYIADGFKDVSVLFADIVDFTPETSKIPPRMTVGFLNDFFGQIDHLVESYNLEKIKTVGDAYMVAAGVPEIINNHVKLIANLALDMQQLAEETELPSGKNLKLRIGIATGPVVAGVIGNKKFSYDLWGDTVNIAARMESQGTPSCIQVTEEVYRRLINQYRFEKRGEIDVKGIGPMSTWYLLSNTKV